MTGTEAVGVDNLEKLQSLRLEADAIAELLATATECTFTFSSDGDGWPSGVVMSFFYENGEFWLTAAAERRHVRSLAADPRVSIVVTNQGTGLLGRRMYSVRGVATVHSDAATLDWFLPKFAAKLAAARPDEFIRLLSSPGRVVLQVRPAAKPVTHDSRKLPGDGRGGPAPTSDEPPSTSRQ
jgi:hypothetical protein